VQRAEGLHVGRHEQGGRAAAVYRPGPAVFAQQQLGRLVAALLIDLDEGHQAVAAGPAGTALLLAPPGQPQGVGAHVRRADDAADQVVPVDL
jgi:hypothetical protein